MWYCRVCGVPCGGWEPQTVLSGRVTASRRRKIVLKLICIPNELEMKILEPSQSV